MRLSLALEVLPANPSRHVRFDVLAVIARGVWQPCIVAPVELRFPCWRVAVLAKRLVSDFLCAGLATSVFCQEAGWGVGARLKDGAGSRGSCVLDRGVFFDLLSAIAYARQVMGNAWGVLAKLSLGLVDGGQQ